MTDVIMAMRAYDEDGAERKAYVPSVKDKCIKCGAVVFISKKLREVEPIMPAACEYCVLKMAEEESDD